MTEDHRPLPPPHFELSRRVEFSAAHRLHNPAFSEKQNREIFGVCNNPHGHGHNYVLDVTVRGPVDPQTGMVMDLNRLMVLLQKQVFQELDHKHLDHDVPWLAGRVSTAENVAAAIWERLEKPLKGRLHRVRLYESAMNFVDYYGPAIRPALPGWGNS
ncbi:MAG: 6-carboxytetrahydropterin synthase [Planctomycetota bacterium]